MKKINYILIILLIAIFKVMGCASAGQEEELVISPDSLLFIIEHEELNGLADPSNPNLIFLDMYIPANNPIRYAEFGEINHLLENGTGIIYLGFPSCPWCRNLVPVLIDAALEFGVEEILYRNILYDRNILVLQDGEVAKIRAGHPGYYQLLEILGEHAPAYAGLNDESIRRVFVPSVIFAKDGEIIGIVQSLDAFRIRVSEDALGAWLPMDEDEVNELTKIFNDFFEKLFGDGFINNENDLNDIDDLCPRC